MADIATGLYRHFEFFKAQVFESTKILQAKLYFLYSTVQSSKISIKVCHVKSL